MRPPGKGRAAYFSGLQVLPAAAAEEAEQEQNEHDDQDDPNKTHGWVTPFLRGSPRDSTRAVIRNRLRGYF